MSSDLKVRFGQDLPAMAVDVVAPDQRVVKTFMLSAGEEQLVSVPSEASFIRVYLPSGPTVVLSDPGNLERTVTREALQSALPQSDPDTGAKSLRGGEDEDLPSRRAIRRHHLRRASAPGRRQSEGDELRLADYGTCVLRGFDGTPVRGGITERSRDLEWELSGPPFERPFELEIATRGGAKVVIRIPGDANRIWARADLLSREQTLTYSVRVKTSEPVADTILNYLVRGNLTAAEAMRAWADQSETLLESKMRDPYAAAVGAYLLLRIQDFDRLRNWTRNLADRIPYLPDGCVLWAWQLIQQDPTRDAEIAEYLTKAAQRGVPVYAEVTRLLLDGLKLMGPAGRESLSQIRHNVGPLVWESPLTMWSDVVSGTPSRTEDMLIERFNVRFGTSA